MQGIPSPGLKRIGKVYFLLLETLLLRFQPPCLKKPKAQGQATWGRTKVPAPAQLSAEGQLLESEPYKWPLWPFQPNPDR